MSDRVYVPGSVAEPYRHVHMQVNENQDPESIRDSFVRAADKDIRKFGQSGNELNRQTLPHLRRLNGDEQLLGLVNWGEEHGLIEALTLDIGGNRRHLHLAAEGVRQMLLRLEHGDRISNLDGEIRRERLLAIFDANIAEITAAVHHTQTDNSNRQVLLATVRMLIQEASHDQLRWQTLATDDSLHVDIVKL